jgi:hypothetical protein
MMNLLTFVGLRRVLLAVAVLVAMWGGYKAIQYIQDTGRGELLLEQLQEQINLRREIDEADRTSPRTSDDADRLLREFYDANR